MGNSRSGRKKQTQILRHALFGKTVGIRMQALLLLAKGENDEGGWLLEIVLKHEKFE